MRIANSVIVITGASAGVGWATSRALAQGGAHVVLVARRRSRLERLEAVLAGYPGTRLVISGDVSNEAFAQEMVYRTVDHFGHVDALINNAGVGHRSAVAEMPTSDIHTILDTNVRGLLYGTRAAVPYMRRQGGGYIVNVSSIVAFRPTPYSSVYSASKAAVNALSRSLRMELRPYNIGVTLVYPGLTATEFGAARLGRQGGNRFGLRGVSPDRVAGKIVAALRNGRSEVYVTGYDWLFVQLSRLLPGPIDWLLSRLAHLAA